MIEISGRTVAIISDVHGNDVALGAALGDMFNQGVDAVVSLGDVAATGPQPNESVRRLLRGKIPSVMGNTDERILKPDPSKFNSDRGPEIPAIDKWCSQKLGHDETAFLSSFSPVLTIRLGGKEILCYHGSPASNTDVIDASTDEGVVEKTFAGFTSHLFAGGHTHVQMLRRHGSAQIINPGSVGLPYDIARDGSHYRPVRAEYAVVDVHRSSASVQFRRVSYDLDDLISSVNRTGMPHSDWWISKWKRS